MDVHILEEAEAEIRSAASWYEEQRSGLGDDFLAEIEHALETIAKMPQAFSQATPPQPGREVRRYVTKRFRYSVFYEVRADDVLILAVTHPRQRPGVWRERQNGD